MNVELSRWKKYQVADLIADGDLFIGDGYRAKNEELGVDGLPFARAGNINGGFNFQESDRFPEKNLPRVGNKVSRPGDVVFTSKGTVGRFAFVRENTTRFVYSPQLCFWRSLRLDVIDPRFLYYWMFGREFFLQYKGVAGQTDMAEYVSLTDQRRMHITLPPLRVQREIAEILGALDDKIELNRRMNETLEAIARAIFHAKFTWVTQAGLPKGWRRGRLRDCCDRIENGGTPRRNEARFWEPATIPWLTSGEVRQAIVTVTESWISEDGLANSSAKLWPPATTVVALYGATAGEVCLLGDWMSANQACCGLIPREDMRYYLYLYASSSVAHLHQQARGSAQQNLSQQIVGDFPAVIPDASTLERFDEIVHPLFARRVANIRESHILGTLRDVLLPKLISGEVRLKQDGRVIKE